MDKNNLEAQGLTGGGHSGVINEIHKTEHTISSHLGRCMVIIEANKWGIEELVLILLFIK